MNSAFMLRRFILAPPMTRSSLFSSQCLQLPASRRYVSAPRIMDTSFWMNLIPKPLRKESREAYKKRPKTKEWNPATFFIFIFLLIGSNAMQLIAMKRDFATFTRRTDAKIGLLKEIIERIKNGEEVDVEGLLGTGDKEREQEWEEVLQEIEKEEQAWEAIRKPKPNHGRKVETDSRTQRDISPAAETTKEATEPKTEPKTEPSEPKPKPTGHFGFY